MLYAHLYILGDKRYQTYSLWQIFKQLPLKTALPNLEQCACKVSTTKTSITRCVLQWNKPSNSWKPLHFLCWIYVTYVRLKRLFQKHSSCRPVAAVHPKSLCPVCRRGWVIHDPCTHSSLLIMLWKSFPHYWPPVRGTKIPQYWTFVREILRCPGDFPHKGPVMWSFDIVFLLAWIYFFKEQLSCLCFETPWRSRDVIAITIGIQVLAKSCKWTEEMMGDIDNMHFAILCKKRTVIIYYVSSLFWNDVVIYLSKPYFLFRSMFFIESF